MQIHSAILSLGLFVAAAVAQTNSYQSACSSSFNVYSSSLPTPTDKALSSFLAAHTTSFDVPASLQKAYCTFDVSQVKWAKATAAPFYSKCSSLLLQVDDSFATSLSAYLKTGTTTATWCSSVTGNAARPRETAGFGAGVMAAAGLVAAVL